MNGSFNVRIVGEVVNQKRDGKLKDKGDIKKWMKKKILLIRFLRADYSGFWL